MSGSLTEVKSLRSFGLTIGAILVAVGLWPSLLYGEGIRLWPIILGGAFIIAGTFSPRILRMIYGASMAIGVRLGRLNTLIILTVIYVVIFVPVGMVMRLLKRDPLQRAFETTTNTYRIVRQPRPGSHMVLPF